MGPQIVPNYVIRKIYFLSQQYLKKNWKKRGKQFGEEDPLKMEVSDCGNHFSAFPFF